MNVEYFHNDFLLQVKFTQNSDTSRHAVRNAMKRIAEHIIQEMQEEAEDEIRFK